MDKQEQAVLDEPIAEVNEHGDLEGIDAIMERRLKEKKEIIALLRKKYPDISLFSATLPYNGTYVIRPQEMSDVRISSKEVEAFIQKKIDEAGGYDEIQKLPEMERANKMREIDAEAADISNEIALKRCVMYPEDFSDRMEAEEPGKGIPAGVVPLLLDKILEVSGWQDVEIEEI